MKKSILIICLILISIVFYSCGGNKASVVNFNPQGQIKDLTTFTIEFSKNLAPESIRGKWLDEEFVKFEPKIEGKFKWITGTTLLFSPDNPLEPIQKYKAEITSRVLFDTKYDLDGDTYEFNTPDFNAVSAEYYWSHVPNEKNKVNVKANIHFNYPVSPEMLKNNIIVKREGDDVKDVKIITDKASDIITISIGDAVQSDKEQSYKIKIKSGLMSVVGKKALDDDCVFKYDLPPIEKLAIKNVTGGMDGLKKWIDVYTTQSPDEKKISSFVKLDPSGKYTYYVNENFFRIEGNFDELHKVNLKIMKGMPGIYGGELESDFEQEVEFENLNPSIKFTDNKGKYLMLNGQRNIEIATVNIDAVNIEFAHIYKNNIIFFLKEYDKGRYYESDDGDGEGYDDGDYSPYYDIENYGHVISSETRKLKGSPNLLEKYTVNVEKIVNDKLKGIFVVNVKSDNERYRRASKMVSITDLGIIAKRSNKELMVFVNSIETTQPVPNVEISLISSNNQTILTGVTDARGIIKFENMEDKIKGFTPLVITAEKGDDFNYIDLRETEVGTSRFDVGGETDYTNGYKTFIYGDRNLYRPGEQVNISGIVRNDDTHIVKDAPILVKVMAPTGKVFEEFKKTLNKEGSFEISFNTPDYAQTGTYRADVYTGADNLIGSYNFFIENFVPDKIRLLLHNDKPSLELGQQISVIMDAEYLFGAKAANLKWQADFQLRHKQFVSKNFASYDFGSSSMQNPQIPNTVMEGTLDPEGRAHVEYTVPEDVQSSGIISGFAFITVFDLTGRPVNRVSTFDVYPDKYFIGIKSPGYYFGTNETINFKVVAVDKNDKVANQYKADAKLVRYEWQTVLKKQGEDRYTYASEQKEIVEWEKEIDLSGSDKTIPVNVQKSGRYELRISKKGSSVFQRTDFWAYGWATSTASSFQVDKEGRVDIVFDKQTYNAGETAKVLFTTPFAGKMLVTLERNGIYDYKYVEVKERSTQVEFSLPDKYIPNVYVTATLFKKHSVDQTTPFLVAHGFASMKVEKKSLLLPVSISAPAKIKSNTKVEVTVKTAQRKDIYVTLAAVDEGILQIKNFETPNPYGFMYAKRALNVTSYDLYKLLLPEIVGSKSSTGGDELAKQLQKRANPLTSKRYKLVSIWSGILKTGDDGTVKVPIQIPQFNGEVRLMAVAYCDNQFGSANASMKVVDDLIMEPQIPRFLAPKDSLVMPVSLVNTTDKDGRAVVNIKTQGPIKVLGPEQQSVNVLANSTAKVQFVIYANSVGNAKITLEASGFSNAKEVTDIGVRPVSPYYTESNSGDIKGGETVKLNVANSYVEGTCTSTLTICKFPAVKFAKHLRYLVGYPYGCVEQTVSKLFPQLYFEDLAKLVAPEYFKSNNSVYYIKEGIRKLESMQLEDGSISYWQGWPTPNWWGTVYAAHFLVEARKAGYNVSDNVMNKLLNYISKRAKEKSTYDYTYYNSSNSAVSVKIANKEILYSLYVLAIAGKGDISTMNYYKSQTQLISEDCRYLLAGAYALMNMWSAYNELVPQNFTPERAARLSGGCFDSEARANAIKLCVLVDVDPNNKQIPFIIKHLSDMLDNIYNTQERSFAFLGMGKAAKGSAFHDVKVDVLADGKSVGSFSGGDISISIPVGTKSVSLKSSGQGEVYYYLQTSGVKQGILQPKDSHLQVRRVYYDYRTGAEIKDNRFKQGQLVLCKITLQGVDASQNNISIADLLPAGFEIDNPRLAQVSQLNKQFANTMEPEYVDIRDDRLILFTASKYNKWLDYYYLIRVVNKGKFVLPMIGAEGMYDGEVSSLSGAGTVIVTE